MIFSCSYIYESWKHEIYVYSVVVENYYIYFKIARLCHQPFPSCHYKLLFYFGLMNKNLNELLRLQIEQHCPYAENCNVYRYNHIAITCYKMVIKYFFGWSFQYISGWWVKSFKGQKRTGPFSFTFTSWRHEAPTWYLYLRSWSVKVRKEI